MNETDASILAVRESSPAVAFTRDSRTWLLYVLLALFGFQQGVLGSVMPFLRDTLAMSTTLVSWHFSIYALGIFLSGFPSRWLIRRVPRLTLLWVSASAVVVATSLIAFGHGPSSTLASAFLMGVTGGVAQATIQTDLAWHHGEKRDVAVTEAYIVAAAGVFLCPLVVGQTTRAGLDWAWSLSAPLVALAVIAMIFGGRVTPGRGSEGRAEAVAAGESPLTVYVCWTLVLLGISAEWGLAFWGPQFLEQQLGLETATAVTTMSLFFGGTIAGRIVNSRLLRTVPSALMLSVSIAAGGAALFALWIAPALWVCWVALVVAGFCLGNFYPLILGVALRAAPHRAAAVSAGCAQAVGVALLTAPMALGLISERIGLVNAVGTLTALPLLMGALLAVTRANAAQAA